VFCVLCFPSRATCLRRCARIGRVSDLACMPALRARMQARRGAGRDGGRAAAVASRGAL
jgi:hypothetical protein